MENLLSALAFAGLIAAQFLSVVLVNTQRCEDPSPGTRNRIARAPACGSLAHSARKAFSLALGCLCDLLMDCSEISSARFSHEVSSRDHRSKRLAPGGKFADARLPGSQISQSIHPTDAVRSRRQSVQE
jgi:hypothetical protein